MLQNRLRYILRSAVQSTFMSALFSSMVLFPSGASLAQQMKMVTVGPAERATILDHVAVIGTLTAKEEVQVNALVEGKEVRNIFVEVGTHVSKGQPLAALDTAEVDLLLERNTVQLTRATAAVAQEHSRVDVASVTERETRKVFERSNSLVGKGIVSQQTLDEHENAFSRARSQLELAHQTLMLAEADQKLIERESAEIALTIKRSIVRATEAGLILKRNARVGAMTSSSGDPLFVIAKDGMVEMEASVSETSFVRLKEGMQADITLPGVGRPIQGRVRLSAAQIDPATRMGAVRVELAESASLVPGTFVHGRIEIERRSSVTIPVTAIRSQNGAVSVFIVENDRAIFRPITLGSPVGSAMEVLAGIEEGDIVVVKSSGFLKSNEQIVAVPVPSLSMEKLSFLGIEGAVAR